MTAGRVAELPAIMAVPGEHLLGAGHPAAAAGGGQDVPAGGQVLQGHHAQGQQGASGHPRCNTARYGLLQSSRVGGGGMGGGVVGVSK